MGGAVRGAGLPLRPLRLLRHPLRGRRVPPAGGGAALHRGGQPHPGLLYTPELLAPFTWDGSGVTMDAAEKNLLGIISLVLFYNNCQGCGDFEMVTGLVDAYNILP